MAIRVVVDCLCNKDYMREIIYTLRLKSANIIMKVNIFSLDPISVEVRTIDNKNDSTKNVYIQRNGYDETTNRIVSLGQFDIQVPDYWDESLNKDGYYQAYAETDGKVAMLSIIAMKDEEDVNFAVLNDEKEKKLVITNFLKAYDEGECLNIKVYETDEIKGILYRYTYKQDGRSGSGMMLCYPSEEDNKWFSLSLIKSDNSKYAYDNDFIKIIKSIKKSK